jgi:S1-C subfamily serine protease
MKTRKIYNKVKKLGLKKIEALKESLRDQAFYISNFISKTGTSLRNPLKNTIVLGAALFISLSADGLHTQYLESKVGDNTVFIRSPEGAHLQGSGTAFEMKAPSGKVYTITNAHVCGLQKDGNVMLFEKHNSKRLVPKRVLEVYEENDLCIVEGLEGYEGLSMGSETTIGQTVWSLGFPLGEALNISKGRVKSFGISEIADMDTKPEDCKGKRRHLESIDMFFFTQLICVIDRDSVQTDMVIYPGNSGSPMVDYFGRVVGVVFASNTRTNWGSVVPLKDLQQLLKAY